MTARSPSAFALSALLHAGVAAVALLGIFYSQHYKPAPPVVFELVAGEGNNYAATEAPALGSPDGPVKFTAPKMVPVSLPATPTVVETAPLQTAPIPTTDLVKPSKRISDHKITKTAAQIVTEVKRMSKEEFDRLHKQSTTPKTASASTSRAANVPRIDAQGIARGVIGGSTANKTGGAGGKALTREEQSLLDSYYAMLRQRLRDALVKPPGLSDRLVAVIEVRILADGTLTDARILQSSGSDEFDHAALDTFTQIGSLGPKPDGRSELLKIPFRMLDDETTP
jgi:TonB family protein